MLSSALEHYRTQQRIQAAGLRAARKAKRSGPLAVAKVVTAYQLAAAIDAARSVPAMLDEQGIPDEPVSQVQAASLAGVASDGRPLDTLFEQAESDYAFGLMVATQLQDVARVVQSLAISTRPNVSGYVRMLNPPSCSRCAVLAGKFYRWNTGFERHPGCDCRHIPSVEALAGDLTTDPQAYFESLPTASEVAERYPNLSVKMRREAGIYSQEDVFTKAGAQAIRDGADVTRVVNARRGMSTAARGTSGRRMLAAEEVGGRPVYITRESTTRRGAASRRRTGRNMSARLMPESIYEVADNREDALRMLRLHGYIT